MTLPQLQKLCERIGRQLTSADVPLKMYNYDIDLELELQGEDGDYWVDVKLIPDAKQFQQMLSERVDYEGMIMDIEELTLDIVENSKPMPPEFAQLVNDNFWDLVD